MRDGDLGAVTTRFDNLWRMASAAELKALPATDHAAPTPMATQ